ncbi:hypothetical protein DPMN_048696 [Dreissena polymorpha]|uniref:Uncharacterized protein n=1 Tax=Dreissena polymorpha TaxID=45954 RepID=A0A9D4DCV1_DREPO|nr:hypothetical protein DPMN_048696 [Dreissena polymorpha]
MIPERNLMAASGLQDQQQSKWIADITEMMDEGPRDILRLPRIRQAVVASPEPKLWFSKIRMELEMLYLKGVHRHDKCRNENGVGDEIDAIQQDIFRRRGELVL